MVVEGAVEGQEEGGGDVKRIACRWKTYRKTAKGGGNTVLKGDVAGRSITCHFATTCDLALKSFVVYNSSKSL